MTRQQQAEMDELGLTPEKLAARQERLKGILGATADQIVGGSGIKQELDAIRSAAANLPPLSPTGKRKRSDAGKPRVKPQPPAPAAVPGAITQEQAARIFELVGNATRDDRELHVVQLRTQASAEALRLYLDALTGK